MGGLPRRMLALSALALAMFAATAGAAERRRVVADEEPGEEAEALREHMLPKTWCFDHPDDELCHPDKVVQLRIDDLNRQAEEAQRAIDDIERSEVDPARTQLLRDQIESQLKELKRLVNRDGKVELEMNRYADPHDLLKGSGLEPAPGPSPEAATGPAPAALAPTGSTFEPDARPREPTGAAGEAEKEEEKEEVSQPEGEEPQIADRARDATGHAEAAADEAPRAQADAPAAMEEAVEVLDEAIRLEEGARAPDTRGSRANARASAATGTASSSDREEQVDGSLHIYEAAEYLGKLQSSPATQASEGGAAPDTQGVEPQGAAAGEQSATGVEAGGDLSVAEGGETDISADGETDDVGLSQELRAAEAELRSGDILTPEDEAVVARSGLPELDVVRAAGGGDDDDAELSSELRDAEMELQQEILEAGATGASSSASHVDAGDADAGAAPFEAGDLLLPPLPRPDRGAAAATAGTAAREERLLRASAGASPSPSNEVDGEAKRYLEAVAEGLEARLADNKQRRARIGEACSAAKASFGELTAAASAADISASGSGARQASEELLEHASSAAAAHQARLRQAAALRSRLHAHAQRVNRLFRLAHAQHTSDVADAAQLLQLTGKALVDAGVNMDAENDPAGPETRSFLQLSAAEDEAAAGGDDEAVVDAAALGAGAGSGGLRLPRRLRDAQLRAMHRLALELYDAPVRSWAAQQRAFERERDMLTAAAARIDAVIARERSAISQLRELASETRRLGADAGLSPERRALGRVAWTMGHACAAAENALSSSSAQATALLHETRASVAGATSYWA